MAPPRDERSESGTLFSLLRTCEHGAEARVFLDQANCEQELDLEICHASATQGDEGEIRTDARGLIHPNVERSAPARLEARAGARTCVDLLGILRQKRMGSYRRVVVSVGANIQQSRDDTEDGELEMLDGRDRHVGKLRDHRIGIGIGIDARE